MSVVKDILFNEKAWKREMGTTESDESRALVSEGKRSRLGKRSSKGYRQRTTKVTFEMLHFYVLLLLPIRTYQEKLSKV